MAISEVKICNMALALVGETQISGSTLTSDTEAERQCSLLLPFLRDALLREHIWNFAESRAELAALVDAPDFEFDYYYQLPSDCLRVIELYDTQEKFRIEADRKIATNASPCQVIYTAQITDPAAFDSLFVQALVYRLASHLAMVLSDNRSLAAELREFAERELQRAKTRDAQEGSAKLKRPKNDWIGLRRGRGWNRK